MSIAALNWAFGLSLPPAQKLTLLAIADRADDNRESWPSVADICERTGLGERTIQRAIQGLAAAGALEIRTRKARSSVYILTLEAAAPPVTVTPPGDLTPRQNDTPPPSQCRENPVTVTPPPRHSGTHNHQRTIKEPPENHQTGARATADEPEGFREFWSNYPRKVGKGQAVRAYRTALKKIAASTLLAAVQAYPWQTDRPEYIPHASTWLNGERWLDQIPQPTRPKFQNGFLELIAREQEQAATVSGFLDDLADNPFLQPIRRLN